MKNKYNELYNKALERIAEQSVHDAMSICRGLENRYDSERIYRVKYEILRVALGESDHYSRDIEGTIEFVMSEWRVKNIIKFLATGRDIDWDQIKGDADIIRKHYENED